MTISIVYDSGFGHTKKLAEATAKGAAEIEESEVHLFHVGEDDNYLWDVLHKSDAIIFGSPTYNGTVSAKLKAFFEASTKVA